MGCVTKTALHSSYISHLNALHPNYARDEEICNRTQTMQKTYMKRLQPQIQVLQTEREKT
jgi:hypothetical protein